MIKLVKILGKGNNAPEIVAVKAPYGNRVKKNSIYYIASDGISSNQDCDVIIRFIPIEDLEEGHKEALVKGYFVTPGMIFEADTFGDFSNKPVGDGFSLHPDSDEALSLIMPDNGGDGSIISKENYEKTGKILIAITTN